MRRNPIAGTTPSSTHARASATCGNCMDHPISSRPCSAARAVTSVLLRERKLTPKNLMNDANVSALVRMAMTANTARYFAEAVPCTAAT